jgi:hypothetical protein
MQSLRGDSIVAAPLSAAVALLVVLLLILLVVVVAVVYILDRVGGLHSESVLGGHAGHLQVQAGSRRLELLVVVWL